MAKGACGKVQSQFANKIRFVSSKVKNRKPIGLFLTRELNC